MKKSTVLALFIIFFVAVFLVGIYGIQAKMPETVYIETISVTAVETNGQSLTIPRGQNYVMLTYEEDLTLMITTRVDPAESTFPDDIKVSIVDESDEENPHARIGERGEIIILRRGSIHVQFRAQDRATGAVLDFWIYAL